MKISGEAMISVPAEWCSPIHASSKPRRSSSSISARSLSISKVGFSPAGWNGAMKIPNRIRPAIVATPDRDVTCCRSRCYPCPRRSSLRRHRPTGAEERIDLLAGLPVDPLADEIGVPVVARVLTDELLQVPSETVAVAGSGRVERVVGRDSLVGARPLPHPRRHRLFEHRRVGIDVP